MLAGISWPQLGGAPDLLDIVGVNYYFNNQWIHGGPTIDIGHPQYLPLHRMLMEIYGRYGRPMVLAETGIEFDRRPEWLRYIAAELGLARMKGVPMEGLCWYPILNHYGWDDDRPCQNGLLEQECRQAPRSISAPCARISVASLSERTITPATKEAGSDDLLPRAVLRTHPWAGRTLCNQLRPSSGGQT